MIPYFPPFILNYLFFNQTEASYAVIERELVLNQNKEGVLSQQL